MYHKTTSRPPIIAKWHMDKFRIRQLLDGVSHVRAYGKGTAPILAHQGRVKAKGNADTKSRPLSGAILGRSWPRGRYSTQYSTSLLHIHSNFSGARRLEFSRPLRIPKEDTLDVILRCPGSVQRLRTVWFLITNNLRFYCVPDSRGSSILCAAFFSVSVAFPALLYSTVRAKRRTLEHYLLRRQLTVYV
jgi:hypothetical protein